MGDFEGVHQQHVNVTLEKMQEVAKEEQQELSAEQTTSKLALQEGLETTVNPFARLQRGQKSTEPTKVRIQKTAKSNKSPSSKENIQDKASQFQNKNSEFKSGTLIRLRDLVKDGDSSEDILKTINDFYPDVTLADEVLDFLLETSDGEMAKTIKEAKELLQSRSGREITAGRNIGAFARAAAEKELGTATSLRDMYRNITGNPRDSTTLFQELSQKYAFKELKKVVDFLLHSLGADLKSKGPSIPRGQLHRLLTETRSLQAILGVYRFFKGRMGLVTKSFLRDGLDVPSQLNFESMSKQFMGLANERYPTSDKALQTAGKLGIEKWIQAKIIALSQFRDAIKEVAVNQIYRSLQHRDELYLSILEALEELEDELDALMNEEDDDEDNEDNEDNEDTMDTDDDGDHVT